MGGWDKWRHKGRPTDKQIDRFKADPFGSFHELLFLQIDEGLDINLHDGRLMPGLAIYSSAANKIINLESKARIIIESCIKSRYKEAIELLSDILKEAEMMFLFGELLGTVHHYLSKLYHEQGKETKAVQHAIMSIIYVPLVIEKSLLLIDVWTIQQNYDGAFQLCKAILEFIDGYGDVCRQVDFLSRAISLASKNESGFEQLTDLKSVTVDTWREALNALSVDGAWSTIRILLFGTDDLSPIVTSYDARDVNLSGLVTDADVQQWKQWRHALCIDLLKRGADYKSICPDRSYPVHVATCLGLRTDSLDLLKHLLSKHDDFCHCDGNGRTLLHVACGSASPSKDTVIKLLLNHGIDVSVKNKRGQMAVDLLPENDPNRLLLLKRIEKKNPIETNEGRICDKVRTSADGQSKSRNIAPAKQDEEVLERTQEEIVLAVINRSWSKKMIADWLKAEGLIHIKNKFKSVDGAVLHELRLLQDQCPEIYYQMLTATLHLELRDTLRVSSAMRKCHVTI